MFKNIFLIVFVNSFALAQSEWKFNVAGMHAGIISPAFRSSASNAGAVMLQTLEVSIPSESYRLRIGVARDNFVTNDKNSLYPPMGGYIEYSRMLGGAREADAYWRHNSGFVSLFNIRAPKNNLAAYSGFYTGLSGTFPIYYFKLEMKADITIGATKTYDRAAKPELGMGYLTQLTIKLPIGEN